MICSRSSSGSGLAPSLSSRICAWIMRPLSCSMRRNAATKGSISFALSGISGAIRTRASSAWPSASAEYAARGVERGSERQLDLPPLCPQRRRQPGALGIDRPVRRPARDARQQRREFDLAEVLSVDEGIGDRDLRLQFDRPEDRGVDRLGRTEEERDPGLHVGVEAACGDRRARLVVVLRREDHAGRLLPPRARRCRRARLRRRSTAPARAGAAPRHAVAGSGSARM